MKKKFTLLIFLLAGLQASVVHAQQGTAASGGDASGSGGTASYTAGLIAYTTITGNGGTATQGIQQPYEIFVLGTDDFEAIRLTVIAYPNPTASVLNLSFSALDLPAPRFELYDLNGKLLRKQDITLTETPIMMEELPVAMYILKVYSAGREVKNFKILKREK